MGLFGYQDTLLANTGKQVYAKSKITGAIDFIFGQTAVAWLEVRLFNPSKSSVVTEHPLTVLFQHIDIRTIAAGSITASGRNSTENPSWYVITNSTVSGISSTINTRPGLNYLGRPWGVFARVVFQYTYLSDVINAAGWSVWNAPPQERTSNVTFAEFGNYGPGSVMEEGPRAELSEQLNEPVAREDILGTGYEDEWWVDMNHLG